MAETPIGGRLISTFRLATPFTYDRRRIPLVELPAPKVGSPYPEGYEHIEFVTDRPLPDFLAYLLREHGYDVSDFDVNGIHRSHHPSFRLSLRNGKSVKFHELPLDEVIAREQGSS